MTMTTWLKMLLCLIPLALAPALIGCGSSAEPITEDDEIAMREHLKEVEDEERAHFEQTEQTAATAQPVFPNEAAARPGGD
jgi:hypothetical protein